MAITNAQQYQQLVNKPANGKRPGYRGSDYGDEAKGTGAYSGKQEADYQSAAFDAGSPNRTTSSGADDRSSPRQTYNTAKTIFENTGKNPTGIDLSKGPPPLTEKEKEREREIKKFIEKKKPTNLKGGLLTQGVNLLNKAGNKFNPKARQYMLDQSFKGKQFFDAYFNNLEDASSVYDLNAEELADLNKAYYQARSLGQIDASGNPIGGRIESDGTYIPRDGGGDNYVPPIIPEGGEGDPEEIVPDRNLGGLAPLFGGSVYDFDNLADGGRAGLAEGGMPYEGGIMDLESGRQMYFLGKLVKKATRAVKKIVKSPIGKAALVGGLGYLGFKGGLGTFLRDKAAPFLFKDSGGTFAEMLKGGLTGKGKLALGGALTLTPLLMGKQEEEDGDFDLDDYYKKNSMDIAAIRNNPYNFLNASAGGSKYNFAANGGLMRTAYAEGSKEPVAKETMPLIDMDGMEKDYREDGGFVPIGRMEKADDVPARLSKNEFVFTADAVRNAGEGDIDKGAEVMYNMMKNLESGGEVSEESQGLDGAREMFKTSQRLEEVL